MSSNFVEEMVGEFYRSKGYLVQTNYWFPFESKRIRKHKNGTQEYSARSWSDIDVLAVGKDEILVIQVKAIINEAKMAKKIIKYYQRTKAFLESNSTSDADVPTKWWTQGKKVRNIVVYEFYSVPKYIEILTNSEIEVHQFSEYFEEIVALTEKKKGFKEENALMRMIHFLNHNHYLNISKTKENF
jgi:hypothetical protein